MMGGGTEHSVENRILIINEYREPINNDDFGSIIYYVGTPNSEEDHLCEAGALLPCIENIKKHLPRVAMVKFEGDISKLGQIELKALLGIN